MKISKIDIDDIRDDWFWFRQVLEPAVNVDDGASLFGVRAKLLSGEYELAQVHAGKSSALVVTHLGEFDGIYCLWLPYVIGAYSGSKMGFVRMARAFMDEFIQRARDAGCQEVRIGGRNWGKIFPDFERFDDKKNRLRIVL